MIKTGPKYVKLKNDLHLACKRLKIVEAKKMELSQKLQKEVANHISKGKFMIAKIKVQTVIRYEVAQEAMEIVEMLCEQILDRYGLFQEMKELDKSLEEAVSSLIWVSPYMRSEVSELKGIFKQLTAKYGSHYSKSALKNKQLTVNSDLMERVKLCIPSEDKIQEYLRLIAKKHCVPEDKKIEMEVFLTKSDFFESKRMDRNIDLVENTRLPSPPNETATEEDVENTETFEGYGNGIPATPVGSKKTFNNLKLEKNRRPRMRWPRKFFKDKTLPDIPEENEDIETDNSLHLQNHGIIQNINDECGNTGDTVSPSEGQHMFDDLYENIKPNLADVNKEVPANTETRPTILLSTYRKKGNFRLKIPAKYESDTGSCALEVETKNFSKKTESSCSIPCSNVMNDLEDNSSIYGDFDEPPSYETVICNTKEDNLDIAHPYQFEVDIKLECFPQYPTLPTCPTLDDISEPSFENPANSPISENLEKGNGSYSDKKSLNQQKESHTKIGHIQM